jgi:hypothetical protein
MKFITAVHSFMIQAPEVSVLTRIDLSWIIWQRMMLGGALQMLGKTLGLV